MDKRTLISRWKASITDDARFAGMDEGAEYSALLGLGMRLLLAGCISEEELNRELA